MSNCGDCKYNFLNWCIERENIDGTPCKGCELFHDGCICMIYSSQDECPYFVQQEEQDEMDRN